MSRGLEYLEKKAADPESWARPWKSLEEVDAVVLPAYADAVSEAVARFGEKFPSLPAVPPPGPNGLGTLKAVVDGPMPFVLAYAALEADPRPETTARFTRECFDRLGWVVGEPSKPLKIGIPLEAWPGGAEKAADAAVDCLHPLRGKIILYWS